MKNIEETLKLYKYDYTEISFNIEDVCFSVYSFHNRDNSLLFTSELASVRPKYSKDKSTPPHQHPYYEIFFTHFGNYEIDVGDEVISMDKDDLVVMPPHILHSAKDKNEKFAICFNFSFKQNNTKTDNKLYSLLLDAFSGSYIHIKRGAKFYDLIINFMTNVDKGNTFMLSRYFYEIITDILSEIDKLTIITPDQMLKDSTISRYRKINYLLSFFNSENISLKFIADSLNLSQRQTARIIKAEFGCTLSEIIHRKRMQQAEKYLLDKKMTIADISAMVGYDSINCFYAAFKKHFGCLPSEYRKRL